MFTAGVLLVGYQINAVTTAMVGVSGTDSELARVLCDLDLDLLQSMDENSDGRVTWGEFLENTLIASDILSQDQIDDINSRYKQLLKQQGSHRTRTAANNLTVEQRLNRIHSHTQHYDRRRVQVRNNNDHCDNNDKKGNNGKKGNKGDDENNGNNDNSGSNGNDGNRVCGLTPNLFDQNNNLDSISPRQGKEKKRAGPEEDGTGIDLRTILSSE